MIEILRFKDDNTSVYKKNPEKSQRFKKFFLLSILWAKYKVYEKKKKIRFVSKILSSFNQIRSHFTLKTTVFELSSFSIEVFLC